MNTPFDINGPPDVLIQSPRLDALSDGDLDRVWAALEYQWQAHRVWTEEWARGVPCGTHGAAIGEPCSVRKGACAARQDKRSSTPWRVGLGSVVFDLLWCAERGLIDQMEREHAAHVCRGRLFLAAHDKRIRSLCRQRP